MTILVTGVWPAMSTRRVLRSGKVAMCATFDCAETKGADVPRALTALVPLDVALRVSHRPLDAQNHRWSARRFELFKFPSTAPITTS